MDLDLFFSHQLYDLVIHVCYWLLGYHVLLREIDGLKSWK